MFFTASVSTHTSGKSLSIFFSDKFSSRSRGSNINQKHNFIPLLMCTFFFYSNKKKMSFCVVWGISHLTNRFEEKIFIVLFFFHKENSLKAEKVIWRFPSSCPNSKWMNRCKNLNVWFISKSFQMSKTWQLKNNRIDKIEENR